MERPKRYSGDFSDEEFSAYTNGFLDGSAVDRRWQDAIKYVRKHHGYSDNLPPMTVLKYVENAYTERRTPQE